MGTLGHCQSNTMASKVMLLLGGLALAASLDDSAYHCNPDNRDCSCADFSYKECQAPVSNDNIHVLDLEECIFQCDLFHSFGLTDLRTSAHAGVSPLDDEWSLEKSLDQRLFYIAPRHGKETISTRITQKNGLFAAPGWIRLVNSTHSFILFFVFIVESIHQPTKS